jgi:hypothetical protein
VFKFLISFHWKIHAILHNSAFLLHYQLLKCSHPFTLLFILIFSLSFKGRTTFTSHYRQNTPCKRHNENKEKLLDDIEISQQEVTFPANILKYFSTNLNCMLKYSIFKHVPNISSVTAHHQISVRSLHITKYQFGHCTSPNISSVTAQHQTSVRSLHITKYQFGHCTSPNISSVTAQHQSKKKHTFKL